MLINLSSVQEEVQKSGFVASHLLWRNNSPLIVINGIPVNNQPVTSGNPNAQGSDLGVPLQSINPDDIRSMTVLKSASAAALYGFRAKDGVIIVTTKSGSKTKGLGIEVRTSYTAERALDFTDFNTSSRTGRIRNTSCKCIRSPFYRRMEFRN